MNAAGELLCGVASNLPPKGPQPLRVSRELRDRKWDGNVDGVRGWRTWMAYVDQEIGAAVKPPIADCCYPAPPVLELDADGDTSAVIAWTSARDMRAILSPPRCGRVQAAA